MKITTYEKTTEVELDNYLLAGGPIDLAKLVALLRVHSTHSDKLAPIAVQASAASPAQVASNLVYSALTGAAKLGTLLSIAASEQREVTGEDILAVVEAAGGRGIYERDPDTGFITSIHASCSVEVFEYDASEMSQVLESLHASGTTTTGVTPAKLLGDLAQTSVGASGSETQVIGLSEWTIDWKRKTADATTTDDATYESSLGSTASWSVKAKYMFIDGDPSQSTNILATINTVQTPQTWNFFPTVAQGRSAFSGAAYVDGITIASGMGKVVGLDVSLKGTGKLYVNSQLAPQTNIATVTGEQAED